MDRFFVRFILLGVLGCSSCAFGTDQSLSVVNSETSVAMRMPNSPVVNFRVSFRVGSINDPQEKNGLNALTALMIGQGGSDTFSFEELRKTFYPWSAAVSAQFDKEVTTIIGSVHRDHLNEFSEIFLELITEPRFDVSDFERNRDSLKNGITATLRGNNDEELGKQTLNGFLYRGHPYEAPELGTEKGLEVLTLEDVKRFHLQHYHQDNVLVGIAGGYPQDFVIRFEENLQNALPAGVALTDSLPAPDSLSGVEVTVVNKQAIATAISIGFPIDVTRADDDFYALLVANSYFGEHRTFNGLLMNKMRGDRGLNYGDYSYLEHFIQSGGSRFPVTNIPRRQQYFSIWIRPVPHHNAHFALRQAIVELKQLVDTGLTEDDFSLTRDFLINYSKLYVQTADRRLGYAMDGRFYGTNSLIDEIQVRLPLLTLDDVNNAIKRHLQYDDLAVAVVTTNADSFVEKLLSNEPSPPTYNVSVSEEVLLEDQGIVSFPLNVDVDRLQVMPVEEMFRELSR